MRTRHFSPLLLLLWACARPSAPVQSPGSDASQIPGGPLRLHVVVEGARNQEGLLRVHLFDAHGGFPLRSSEALRRVEQPLSHQRTDLELDGLAPGRYALAILHDENADGRIQTDWLGRPREGYAFSQGARLRRGLPQFEEAAFDLAESGQSLVLQLIYP